MEQNLSTTKTLSERNLSLDILKILSMVMVIILHTKIYGLRDATLAPYSNVYWVVLIFHIFSLVAVNCFVLISGYFLSKSSLQPKKLLNLWLQTFIFSAGIFFIVCIFNKSTFGLGELLSQLLPVMSNQYWFFTCYFVLMLLSPFINKLINSLEQKDFKKLIFVLLFIFMAIPTLNVFGDNFDSSKGYSATWFIVLYCVGAYIRRFPLPKKPYGVFYIAISLISVIINAFLESIEDKLLLFASIKSIFSRYNSATVFLASVCLFLFFINRPIHTDKKWGKIISTVSASSFSVYLIHEHPYIRNFIWNDTVRLFEATNNLGSYLLRILITVISILVLGTITGIILNVVISFFEKTIYKAKNKE